jgi:hypothetical protein
VAGSEAATRPTGEELVSDGAGVLASFCHQALLSAWPLDFQLPWLWLSLSQLPWASPLLLALASESRQRRRRFPSSLVDCQGQCYRSRLPTKSWWCHRCRSGSYAGQS